jgi:RHS repeat-associated protein
LSADTIAGSGRIEANGPWVNVCSPGCGGEQGGGGRVAIYGSILDSTLRKNINISGYSAGTVYFIDSSLAYGVLSLDNKGIDGPDNGTYVTSIGSGTISYLTPDTLVCDTCHFPVYHDSIPGLKGLTVEANPTNLHFLDDQFKILWNDSTRMVVDTTGGKSLLNRAVLGNMFQGIINLDTLRIKGKAKGYSNDPVIYDYIDILDGRFTDPEQGVIIGSAKWDNPEIRFASLNDGIVNFGFRPYAKEKQSDSSVRELIAMIKPHLNNNAFPKDDGLLAANLLKTAKGKIKAVSALEIVSVDELVNGSKVKGVSVSSLSRINYATIKPRANHDLKITNSIVNALKILSDAKARSIYPQMASDNGFAQLRRIQSNSAISTLTVVGGKEKAVVKPSKIDVDIAQMYSFVSRYNGPQNDIIRGTGKGSEGIIQIASAGLDPQYTYDKLGRRTSMTDPTGTTNYEYDPATGNLSAIVDPNGKRFEFTYNKGQLQSMSYPNGITANYVFDDNGNLTALDYARGGANVAKFNYGYDDNNMRTSMTDNDGIHNYGYDQLYQIISAAHPTAPRPLEQFTYDEVGNRLTLDENPFVWQYDDLNRLLEDDKYRYKYDADGNMELKVDKTTGDSTKYIYNVENKMVKVEKPDTVVEFVYDAFGRRLAKIVNGTAKQYRYDGEDLILEINDRDSTVAKYTFGPGIDRPLKMVRNGNEYYYLADGLGSIRAMADETGSVVQEYKYSVFGEIGEKIGSIENPFTYTAREWDGEIGLYYYRARFYDARVGRFGAEDPRGFFSGMNYFIYCRNNSTIFVDPSGLSVYYVNNDLDKIVPTENPISHSFVAITEKGSDGKEHVVETYSWTNRNGGQWEKNYKPNILGAQWAIDEQVGVEKYGDDDLNEYAKESYSERKGEKGTYNLATNNCKHQAGKLLGDAQRKKQSEEYRGYGYDCPSLRRQPGLSQALGE